MAGGPANSGEPGVVSVQGLLLQGRMVFTYGGPDECSGTPAPALVSIRENVVRGGLRKVRVKCDNLLFLILPSFVPARPCHPLPVWVQCIPSRRGPGQGHRF